MYKAILKVKEQDVIPGTGEGGIAALVNKYIGRNGIKISLKDIPPGGVQRILLRYINMCSYYRGETTFEYPLDTQQFITYPVDLLSVSINVKSNSDIQSYDLVSHSGWNAIQSDPKDIRIEFNQSKAYLNRNLEFRFTVPNDELDVDFFSVANDTMDGHFVLMVKPDESIDSSKILNKKIIFLLDNSSSMFGYKLDQSKEAIALCLDLLQEGDYFNVIAFCNYQNKWKSSLQSATPENIQSAKSFLNSINTSWGSNLISQKCMTFCLKNSLQFTMDPDFS